MPEEPLQDQAPGRQDTMRVPPDCGETSYRGCGRLAGKVALITGGDSGIGRAVAIAFAREGADLVLAYLDEHDDAAQTADIVRDAGRRAVLVPGDVKLEAHCRKVVETAIGEFGRLDVLVSNAAHQMSHESLEEISADEWDGTFATNVSAFYFLCRAALPYLGSGSSIIVTSSINADTPSERLLPYAATKAALSNLAAGLAQQLGSRGIGVNSVAPGPLWTPLIPATMPLAKVATFGSDTALGRPGQPVEVAPVFVLLASDEASYISGAQMAVTRGWRGSPGG